MIVGTNDELCLTIDALDSKLFMIYARQKASIKVRAGLLTRLLQKKTYYQKINDLLIQLKRMQEDLFLACIVQGNTVRRVLDADGIE